MNWIISATAYASACFLSSQPRNRATFALGFCCQKYATCEQCRYWFVPRVWFATQWASLNSLVPAENRPACSLRPVQPA